MLTCIAALLQPSVARTGERAKARGTKHGAARPEPEGERAPARRSVDEEHMHVRRGDTLSGLLAARGVGPSEAREWLQATASVYDLRQLRPRRGLTLRFDREMHALQGVRYEIDDRALLLAERTPAGIRARRAPLPYFVEVKGAAGRVVHAFREDALDSGIPESIVSELADVFGWEVDVANDLRPGDEFRVLYENIWEAGDARPEPGKVLAAEVVTRGRPITAVLFEDADGRSGYYRPNGTPLSHEFLRYPVEFTEISSDFSLLRRHPILGVTRPHLGVDLAAPTGTPVRAVANGTVTQSGWAGQLGQCIRLGHPGGIESTYGHLSRIAAGVKDGATIERGQVIGYVGSTGLSTGSHLHFAMYRDGEYIDPLEFTGNAAAPIPALARRGFERMQTTVTQKLAALPATENPLTVKLSSPTPGTRRE
jgi:murein DD-endopeptidase MepM/ murein hydrolase activator NlpD